MSEVIHFGVPDMAYAPSSGMCCIITLHENNDDCGVKRQNFD